MKKAIATLLIMLALVACGSPANAASDSEDMFVLVEQGFNYRVVYCQENKVMYVVSYSKDNYGNFTLLVNPDGSPMLYGVDYDV